jgi:hypothetical protein
MDHLSRKSRRQRAILSCNDCRRRKLKCDRLDPCDWCIKGGIAESCAYGPEPHSVAPEEIHDRPTKRRRQDHGAKRSTTAKDPHASASEQAVHGQNDQVQSDTVAKQRLEQLEHDIALLRQHVPSQAQEPKDQVEFLATSPELKGIIHSSADIGVLKGRSYATHFYGESSAMSIVAHVSFQEVVSWVSLPYVAISWSVRPLYAPSKLMILVPGSSDVHEGGLQ